MQSPSPADLATEGFKPFCAIYSTFLQRGYDQVVHDVAIQKLPVRFAIDRAGLVGADGATHAGSFDVCFLGILPGMVVMAAADEAELVHMVATAAAYGDGPIALRYPRGDGVGIDLPAKGKILEIGRGRILREGNKVAILSLGTRLADALNAAEDLATYGVSTTVADARFAKPLDSDLLFRLAANHEVVITVEEGSIGGFGSFVMQTLAEEGMLDGVGAAESKIPVYGVARPFSRSRQAGETLCGRGPRRERHRRQGAGDAWPLQRCEKEHDRVNDDTSGTALGRTPFFREPRQGPEGIAARFCAR